MASEELQVLPQGRSRPPDVKFWEDFVLFGMPGRDVVFYYTNCSDQDYWSMNIFLLTQLLTRIDCCGRSVWAFIRVVKPFQHRQDCGWVNILQTFQNNLLIAFPWMNSKRASMFWLYKIVPDYIRSQARCLENKWPMVNHLLDPGRKETMLCLSLGGDLRKPSFSTWVSLLELNSGEMPTVNPDGMLKLANLSLATIMARMPHGSWGQLHYADSFWNLHALQSDDDIRQVMQSEYDSGHEVFYFHIVSQHECETIRQ